MKKFSYLMLFFIALALCCSPQHVAGNIGAILDTTSRAGKEAKLAMEMAVNDFNKKSNNRSLVLHLRDSQSKPAWAALAARDLVDTQQVRAILGSHTWEEVSSILEVSSEANTLVFSLADSTPQWATMRWPYLIQASPNQNAQMKAVAAVVQSLGQNQVAVIYEDTDFSSSRVVSHLSDALVKVGVKISHSVALSSFSSSSLSEELERLKIDQCRVFVVHTSLALALRLFQNARDMNMMEADHLWITTNKITDLLHSIDDSTMSSIQGVLGVGSYFPSISPKFQNFRNRFRKKFSMEHPEEENSEPGISSLQAYDATILVAQALASDNCNHSMEMIGKNLLEKLLVVNYNGLSGKLQFSNRKLADSNFFQVVNVVGKTSKFWSDEFGKAALISFNQLGPGFWHRQPCYKTQPRRLLSTSTEKLRVGVPTKSHFKQFVNLDNKAYYTGFSIEVFREIMSHFPDLQYEFVLFDNSSYNALVGQVSAKNFDAVAGDVTILASRSKHADFTQPYTESGLEMIVAVKSRVPNKAWLFLKPFTKPMWGLIAAITIYNGFVIWFMERNHSSELKGSTLDQKIGILIWLAFTTLFSLHGEKLHSNLSRLAMVVWLFVAIVITQSYTASLASMLTAKRLEPRISNIESLKEMNASVGNCEGSFLVNYLENVVGFERDKIKEFNSTQELAKALRSGEIGAVFLGVPKAKVFLAQYCKSFVRAGETYKIGGLGFAFSKGFPRLDEINEVLLNVSESGKLRELEEKFILSEKCVDVTSGYDETSSLSLDSFWVLFVLTGGTSTIAITIYAVIGLKKLKNAMPNEEQESIYKVFGVVKGLLHQGRQFSSRVGNAESPRSPPNSSDIWSTHV